MAAPLAIFSTPYFLIDDIIVWSVLRGNWYQGTLSQCCAYIGLEGLGNRLQMALGSTDYVRWKTGPQHTHTHIGLQVPIHLVSTEKVPSFFWYQRYRITEVSLALRIMIHACALCAHAFAMMVLQYFGRKSKETRSFGRNPKDNLYR